MSVALVDDAARRRITRDGLDELLFVEAGAGTGKTKQLVDRVVALVLTAACRCARSRPSPSPRPPRASCAAGSARRSSDSCTTPPPPWRTREQAELALSDLDGAAIGTVHSFAQRILAEHPVEAGLPPQRRRARRGREPARVRPPVGGARRPHVRGPRTSTRSIALASRLKIRIDDQQARVTPRRGGGVLRQLGPLDRHRGSRHRGAGHRPHTGDDRHRRVRTRRSTTADAIADDKLAAHWLAKEEELLRLAAALVDAPDRRLLGPVHGTERVDRGGLGNAADWGSRQGRGRGSLAQAIDVALEEIGDAAVRRGAAASSQARSPASRSRAADERRREGRLEFHDLLVLARRLLRDRARRRARRARTSATPGSCIDEFQDTDPIQIELAMLHRGRRSRGEPAPTTWPDSPSTPGRLFFVGDPKQSIYRFRRADIGLFLDARDRFAAETGAAHHQLPDRAAASSTGSTTCSAALMAEERPGAAAPATSRSPRTGPAQPGRATGRAARRPHAKDEKLRGRRAARARGRRPSPTRSPGSCAEPDAWPVEDGDGLAAGAARGHRDPAADAHVARRRSTDALRARGVEYRAETGTLVYETPGDPRPDRDPAAVDARCRRGRARRRAAVADPRLRRRRPAHLRRRRRPVGPRRRRARTWTRRIR